MNKFEQTVEFLSLMSKPALAMALEGLHRVQLTYLTSGYHTWVHYSCVTRGSTYSYIRQWFTYRRKAWGLCSLFKQTRLHHHLMEVMRLLSEGPEVDHYGSFLLIQDSDGSWKEVLPDQEGSLMVKAIQTRTAVLNRMIEALEEAIDRKAKSG